MKTTRILSIILALLLTMMVFASCGPETPYELYQEATKKMEEATAAEVVMTYKISMDIAGMSNDTTITMSMKTNGDDFAMDMGEQGVSMIYVGGVLYMSYDFGDGDAEKMKATCSVEKFKELMEMSGQSTDASSPIPTLTEEDLKEIEWVEDGDNRKFTMTLTADQLTDVVGSLTGMMGGDPDEEAPTIAEASITPVFNKDGDMTNANIVFKMDLEGMTIDCDLGLEFKNIGGTVEIKAPADADQYEEMDIEDLLG